VLSHLWRSIVLVRPGRAAGLKVPSEGRNDSGARQVGSTGDGEGTLSNDGHVDWLCCNEILRF
jgi:hypothetical protein